MLRASEHVRKLSKLEGPRPEEQCRDEEDRVWGRLCEGSTSVEGPCIVFRLPGKAGPLAVSSQGIRTLHAHALGLHHLPTPPPHDFPTG